MEFKIIDKTYGLLDENKYVSVLMTIFLTLYGGMAAPKLPKNLKKFLKNDLVRLSILSLIVFNTKRDLRLSVVIASGFLLLFNQIEQNDFEENFAEDVVFADDDIKKKCKENNCCKPDDMNFDNCMDISKDPDELIKKCKCV